MRSKKLFAVVLFVVLAALGCAMSAFATTINPETDAVFTCDSDPADFNGKTFENLYVLLNGCDNLRATVLPEDNVFVTLRDITVNGTLYYVDDTYDAETGTYTEALPGNDETHAAHQPDHYLNFAASTINRLEMNCIDPHTCHLNIHYPSHIDELFVYPTNPLSLGEIDINGQVAWLVDEETDYYHDSEISWFVAFEEGEYNFNELRHSYGNPAVQYPSELRTLNQFYLASYADFFPHDASEELRTGAVQSALENTSETDSVESAYSNIYRLLWRGHVNKMFISNKYEQEPGETYITLGNIRCNQVYVSNNHREDGYYRDTYDLNWKPVIEAVGYTNIGILSVYSDLSLKTLDAEPYKADSTEPDFLTAPLFVDAMVVGTEGRETNIDLDHVKIFLLNYFGGISDDSKLTLTTKDLNTKWPLNQTGIGTLTVNGGNFELLSERMFSKSPTVFEFYILPGRGDLRYAGDESGIVDAASIANIAGFDENVEKLISFASVPEYSEITEKVEQAFYDSVSYYENDDASCLLPFMVEPGTVHGSNWIYNFVLNYLTAAEPVDGNNYNTHIDLKNTSIGNIYVDPSISSKSDNYVGGSCNFYQWGTFGGRIVEMEK